MSDSVKKYYELVEEGVIKPNEKTSERPYIYESPDKGKTVYRRKFGDITNRELIKKETIQDDYTELELVDTVINISKRHPDLSASLILQIAKDELSVKKVCD